ncbi:MAG: hypothetical protein AABY32_00950 [Nanoarchaeota archaeon]
MKYFFVIDTEQYAGNFQREMAAYITGRWDFETHGEKEADAFIKEEGEETSRKFDETIIGINDDEHGWFVAALIATPGWFNNGLGGEFRDGQDKEAEKHYNKESKRWEGKYGDKAEKYNGQKYPSYQSIGVVFSKKPTDKMIETMKRRAKDYAKNYKDCIGRKQKINITNFRLVTEKIIKKEIYI